MEASSLMKTIDMKPKSLRIRFQDSKPTTSPAECGVPQRSRSNIYNVALIVIFDSMYHFVTLAQNTSHEICNRLSASY